MTHSGMLASKRAILLSAKLRFSSETQPIKDIAVDKAVEQTLLLAHDDNGLDLTTIQDQGTVTLAGDIPVINRFDIEKSLERLVAAGRVVKSKDDSSKAFWLSASAMKELEENQKLVESRFESVVEGVFANCSRAPSSYAEPFLDFLCRVFSKLGDNYVRLINGEICTEQFLSVPNLNRILNKIKKRYRFIQEQEFKSAIRRFFEIDDPDYAAVKWNMAQNFYIAKALGLDSSGHLLSREVFGNAVFYLDTNILISALEPKADHHASFKALSAACKELKIELKTCLISINELKNTVEYQRELISKVADQIPSGTASKVGSVFYRLYEEHLKKHGTAEVDEVFAAFAQPQTSLVNNYDVEIVDDIWFDEAEREQETQSLQQTVVAQSQGGVRKPKGHRVALHDALLLRWVALERERGIASASIVTLDNSLPRVSANNAGSFSKPLAITLDTLLQLVSPLAMHEDDEDKIAAVFSEAVRQQLLPQEKVFDLGDFVVFANMEMDCRELPAEDVEGCLQYLKANAYNLNPANPVDQQKLSREISKFFADPGRKHAREVQRLEAQLVSVQQERELEENRKNAEHEQKLREHTQESKRQMQRDEAQLRERDERIRQLEKERNQRQKEEDERERKRSANRWLAICVLIFIAFEIILLRLVNDYGKGPNILQRVENTWALVAGVSVAVVFVLLGIMGRDRLRLIGMPLPQLFGGDGKDQ